MLLPTKCRVGNYKFDTHFPKVVDITLMVLKGHLLVEEEINEILYAYVSNPNELESASLSFYQKLCIFKAFVHTEAHEDFYAAEMLNRLRNKIAHNLDPVGFENSIVAFLEAQSIQVGSQKSPAELIKYVEEALLNLYAAMCAFKDVSKGTDLRDWRIRKETD